MTGVTGFLPTLQTLCSTCVLHPFGLSVGGFKRTENHLSLSQAELAKHHGISKYAPSCVQGKSDHFLHKKGCFKASNKYPLRLSWFFLRNMKTSLATIYQQLILPKEQDFQQGNKPNNVKNVLSPFLHCFRQAVPQLGCTFQPCSKILLLTVASFLGLLCSLWG